jgi:hypothetical protein
MKTNNLIIVLSLVGLIQFSACGETFEEKGGNSASMPSLTDMADIGPEVLTEYILQMPIEELSDKEIEGLVFMREEEKLARDIYLNLYEKWSLLPFKNISKSEQAHMDAILALLNKYNIDDPAEGNEIGVFKNKELQELYDQLIEQGLQSATEALKVGALIEEVDIIDLQKIIDEDVDNEDIEFVLNNLKRASGYHLRAFVRNLSRYNVTYEPLLLDQEIFNEILQ